MSSASSKRVAISPTEWKRRLAGVDISKEDLNELILLHFFHEGYRESASTFLTEAGINAGGGGGGGSGGPAEGIDLDSIDQRMNIRRAVQSGELEKAVEGVNELDPEILDTNPTLHFHLLLQQLIELIRTKRIPDALVFAQTELAPRGEENPEFLKELEKVMTLLAFELPALVPGGVVTSTGAAGGTGGGTEMPPTLAALLDFSHRQSTAEELNTAILTSQSHGKEAKLPALLRLLSWGEEMLGSKAAGWEKWDYSALDKNPGGSSADSTSARGRAAADVDMVL